MSNPRVIRPMTVAAAVALAMGGKAMPVWSADDTAKSADTLEEIVVTATRRAQSVQEIPFNISAVSGADLEKANIIESVEALRSVAGVAMIDRGYRSSGVTNGIVIRGINVDAGSQGDVPLAAPPTVATYVDNTALFGNFILKDIERIEVLRGPQSTLYGSGSLAGNVRYIMTKPDLRRFSGEASMGYSLTDGSDGDNLNPDLMLNVPLGDSFRAARQRGPGQECRRRRLSQCLRAGLQRRPGRHQRRYHQCQARLSVRQGCRHRRHQVRARFGAIQAERYVQRAAVLPEAERRHRRPSASDRVAPTSSTAASTANTSSAVSSSSPRIAMWR